MDKKRTQHIFIELNNLPEASQHLYNMLIDPNEKGVKIAALLLDEKGKLLH